MFRRIVLLLLSIIISACGGEESYPEYPKDRQQGILSGVVFDAAVSNATVRVYEFNQGKVGRLLATTNTNPDGRFSVALTAGSTPLYIESSGGGFLDPYSNHVVTANDRGPIKLRTYVNFIEGQSRKVMLTPLTNIAVGLADYNMMRLGQQTAAAIESANAAVNSQYGFDVIATEPLDISKGNWSAIATQGHQYGAFLLAYSSLAYESLQNSGGSDSEKNIYTSYNLADLQFRDIQATGQLDGWSMDEVSALPVALSYGLEKINADFYTNSMAQHLLRVVNNPEVNTSGTPPGDYSTLVNKLNNASGGIYATRTPEIIDDEPPVVTRVGQDVLSGSGLVTVKVTDFIGIDSVDVYIQTRPEGGNWGESESCMGSNSALCSVQSENIKSGVREAQVVTKVNTLAIDQLSTEAMQARLVFGVADVLENANNTNYVPLQWDNIAPTINITSPGAFNPVNQQIYILSGTIEDAGSDIASVSIGVNAGVPEPIACTMQLDEATQEEVCVFSKTYDKTLFIGGQTNFFISASDVSGNTKVEPHVVLSDTTAPTQAISFPQVAMKFFDADAGEYQDNLTQEYFQDLYGKQYLNLNYAYALQGLKGVHPDVDFSDFTSLILDQNQIPYLVLTVSDSAGGSELTQTSAEDLVVTVTYEAGNIGEQATIIHKQVNLGDKIPHEILPEPDADGYINQVRYFIPFVKEIFGSDFTRVNEQHAQTITIVTKDRSGNTSVPYKFQFKSTFNLPTIKITAPYINASANVERLLGSGKWGLVGSCTLLAQSSTTSSEKLKDAANCTLNSQFAGEIHRVTLTGPSALFYNWSKEERQTVTLTEENGLRAYAVVGGGNGNRELVVTELSVFQSGFFDYLFEQSDKSQATAKSLLSQVDAMFGEQSTQFFGFNPVSTRYATADELAQIPNPPSSPYLYRFLLEAMVKMSESVPIKNSIDLAKSFYSDISSNGKPDGLNAAGESVDFGGLPLSERFYREELGKQFYAVTAGDKSIYPIDSKVAMYYANRFAKSDPKLQGQPVFTKTPEPVDQEPPSVTIDPLATNLVETNNRVYISGDLSAIANVSDPSGLDKSTFPTKLELLWGDDDSVDATNLTGVTSILIDNDPYQEKHQFGVNTLNNFPGIARLDLLLSSSDREGNSHGYHSMLPFSKIYYVDNEPPSYSFTPPFRADALPDDTYINTNYKQLLKFTIDERVGEDASRRRFIFRNGSQERVVSSDEMVTEGNVVKIFLCRAEKCNGDSTPTVDLGPGKWVLLTEGGDSLGNTITATDPNVGRYQVNIDYEEPAILPTEISMLGGNEQWAPISVINNGVGNVSPLGDIQLQLHTGAGLVELEPCIQGQDCSGLPAYTLGDKGNTKVQLVADNLIHGKTYTLYISASDTAFQPNIGEGKFEFKVDKMGPSITTPTLADGTAPELSGNIMGTRFKVSIASITDDSGVEDVSVWQELTDKNVQLVEAFKPEGLNNIDINLQPANTALIQTDEGKQIKIFVKATDSHGFEGRSNAVSTLFDNEGPTISLINYSPDDFYVPGFIFNVAVRDEGVNPIAPGAVSYWTYTGSSPAPGDEGKQPTNETQIETNMQQDFTLKIRAQDIRGNAQEKPFAIKVDKTAPEVSLTARYQANDLEISPNENITKNGTVDLYLNAFDPESQIDSNIEASLIRDGNTEGETIVFSPVEGNDRLWKSQLNTQIANDGQYNLIVTVYNRAKANKPEERKKNRLVRSLKVQREGYSLSITKPIDFGTHVFGRSFRAEFGVQNAPGAILNKLECWLREDYNSDKAPDNDTSGLYKVYTNTATPVCQFDNVDTNLLINPVLITRTTASNEAQVDQIFSFNMLDVDAPLIANKDAFILKQGDVDTIDGVKKLTIRVTVDDVLSGMDSTATVKLLKGLTEYEPTSIQPSNGNQTITYTFTGDYEDLIRRGQIEHFVKLTGLKDKAGNIVVDTDANIQLRVPNVKPDIEITGVKNGDFINGQEVNFFLKKSVGEEARQENIFVDLGASAFDFLTNRNNFPTQTICADDPAFECIKFEGNISPDHANSTIKIKARIVDIWGNEAETYLELGIDNKPPKISDIYSISSNTSNQVLVNFDISDEDSGLKAVKYTVKDIGNSSFIVDKSAEDETIAQLEFDTSKLGNEKSFRVEIKATDNVGQVQSKDFTIDITKPTVTLELPSVAKEQSNLILQNLNQTFNIITSAVPETRAEVMRYVFTLVALDPGLDNISVEGNFAGIDSATGSLNLNESLQGRYDLKLSVFDNLGRDISSFTLKDETVPTTQKPVLVDMANPVIANAQSQQQAVPPVNNKFVLHVSADISDHHLIDSSVTASLSQGASTILPVKVVRPDAPSNTYLFEFLVEAGSYELTLNAADAAGHSQSLIVPAVTVDPWQVPTVAVSTQDGLTELGSGQDATLVFDFSEPVSGFAAEDIVLTATSGGDAGTLSGLAEQSPGRWTAVYRTPVGVDTGITLSVTADSYVSAATQLAGSAGSLSLDVIGSPLTASVSLPEGDEVSRIGTIAVTFTFNRPVSGEVVPLPAEGVWSNLRKNPGMTEITYDFSPQSLAVGVHQVGVAAGYLDDYGNAGLAASLPVTVTNIAPVIGADFSLVEQAGQVVMDFDITDAESALATVRYTVLDLPGSPITVEKAMADGNLSQLSFDAAQLGGAQNFRVQIEATDDAGAVVNRELSVDIALTAVTLSVPGSQLSGGQLMLTSADPGFTVSTVTPAGSRAGVSGYTLTLVARDGAQSDIVVNGQFSGNASVVGQLPVQIADQGEYDLTLNVQDSLGRTVSEYSLNGDNTAVTQLPVLLDLENPVIANVQSQQQAVPPLNNEYVLQVSADISDLHLVDSTVTARLSNGGAVIAPVQVTRPDAPSNTYLFEFLVEAGSYELTINAADTAGHSQSLIVPAVTVAPWQVPTVAVSTQDGLTELGSGQDTTLMFDFSEPVSGFAAEDIVLTAASGGDAGTLSGLAEQSPGRWTAVYRAPVGVDTGITLSVTADSYVSAATQLAGSAGSLSLDVIGSPLTASVSLPEGDEVSRIGTITVTFTFNRPVSGEVVPLPAEGGWSNLRKNPGMTEITYDFSPQALAVGVHQVGVAAGYLDDYGNAGLAASLPVTVTNIAPVIGADFSLAEQGGQVVMDFDITDAESALATVRYTVLDLPGSPITVEKTLADGNLSQLSFDAAQLGGAQSLRVQIEATDDAGAVVNRELSVDIALTAVTLSVPGSQLSGGQLLLTSADPGFTVSTVTPAGSRAGVSGYTLTLVARDGAQSDIVVSGPFSGSSDATGQLPLQLSEQGEYDLNLSVQDNLGRTVSEYTLNGESTAVTQLPVLLDLENPLIANVQSQQQAVPPLNNEYVLQVSADISDLHLVDSTVTARLSNGGAVIAPVQVTRPDAPSNTYLFEFLVEAGSYELTFNAADTAGHSQSLIVPAVTVAPWQVPTVAVSTQDGLTELGSGQDTTLMFDFSEPVSGFAAEDIVLTAASGGDAGTLSGLAEQSPGRWTAVYRAPVGVDTGITLSVTADSYVSAATQLAGSAGSLSLDVIGSPLTASVSLPEGDEVSRIGTIAVTFTFNRPVSGEVVPLPEEGVWSNLRKNPGMTEITYDFSPQALAVGVHQVGVAAGYLDDYGNAGLAASLPVTVTNIAPVIGADFSLAEQGGQVVMDFDITDAESALASVRYTVLDLPGSPITVEKTLADGNLSRLSFDAAQLGGAQSFRVQIEVTDDAGAVVNRELSVDIALTAVTLSVPGSQLSGGQLLLTSADPGFTVSTVTPVGSRAGVSGYTLTLVARDGAQSDIVVSGPFSGSSDATGQLPLQLSEQGEYDLNLSVQDNLGRTVSEYTLSGDSTAVTQLPVLIDLENPLIANVQSQQQAVPPVNNEYVLQVSADISDLYLVNSAVTASLSNGGAVIAPVQVIRPDAPSNTYLFEFLVEAGSYELTINAADAAGHSQSQIVPAVTVAPWQVPTVAVSTQDGLTELGSGQDATLVFDFSEPVSGFAAEDIVLTAASGGDAGTLSGLAEQSPGRWTAVYRTPVGVDTGITLNVTADSYVSAATQLPGSAGSLSLDVIGSPLTASVSLPEGNEVSRIGTIAVTFTFNRPVSGEVVPLPEEGVWSNLRKNPGMTEITYDFSPQSLAVGVHQVGVAAGYLDDYGNAGLAASLPVTVTNIAPVIGADFSLAEQGGQVVMDFDITDAESALATVRYTVLDLPGSPITVEKTLADGNLSQLSFDAAQLGGAQSFRVQIEATDDAGAVVNRELSVDIALTAVTLSVPGSQLSGGQLLLTSADSGFTVSTVTPVGSRAGVSGYTLTLVARDGAQSDIVVSGPFSGSSDATGQLPLQLSEQGEYDLNLSVQDNLGRTVSEYTLSGESTATAQLPVLVDLEQPQILNVHTVQLPLAPAAGKYFIRATADIVDLNLDSSKMISVLDNGVEQTTAFHVSAPPEHSDTYSFDFNVVPGNYNLIIKATDLAGNEIIFTTENIVVEPWTVPSMNMTVRDPDSTEMGGGKAVWLDLHFSEVVNGFSQDDLIATPAAGGEAGAFSEFSQLSATHWQVRYTAPAGVDTDITIQVSAGSYTAADDEMPGSESQLSLSVVGSPLTTNITFQDGNTQVIKGERIEVTIVFNRPVLAEPVLTPANTEFVSFWSTPVINPDRTAFIFDLDTTEFDLGETVIGVEAGDQDQYGNMGQAVTAMLTVN